MASSREAPIVFPARGDIAPAIQHIRLSMFEANTLITEAAPHFNGDDYQPDRDDARLTNQFRRIFDLMKDGSWRTLGEIETSTSYPQASISAQLRHMRKPRFGGHTVEKRHVENGLYQYRVLVSSPVAA